MSCGKFIFPSRYLPLFFYLGSPISCGKFACPSHDIPILDVPSPLVNSSSRLIGLPLFILDVPCHVVNSSSHLMTCHFPSWKSHLLWKIRFPISLPATSHLGSRVSCGKSVFTSHYLPLFILDIPSPVVNSSSHLITCHFPSWTSHLLW